MSNAKIDRLNAEIEKAEMELALTIEAHEEQIKESERVIAVLRDRLEDAKRADRRLDVLLTFPRHQECEPSYAETWEAQHGHAFDDAPLEEIAKNPRRSSGVEFGDARTNHINGKMERLCFAILLNRGNAWALKEKARREAEEKRIETCKAKYAELNRMRAYIQKTTLRQVRELGAELEAVTGKPITKRYTADRTFGGSLKATNHGDDWIELRAIEVRQETENQAEAKRIHGRMVTLHSLWKSFEAAHDTIWESNRQRWTTEPDPAVFSICTGLAILHGWEPSND